jgi:hypothetical protein
MDPVQIGALVALVIVVAIIVIRRKGKKAKTSEDEF